MNYLYLFIGIVCGLGGIAILIWLMIPPKSLRAKAGYNRKNPFNDSNHPHNDSHSN